MTRPVFTTSELCTNADMNAALRDIPVTGLMILGEPDREFTGDIGSEPADGGAQFYTVITPVRGRFLRLKFETEHSVDTVHLKAQIEVEGVEVDSDIKDWTAPTARAVNFMLIDLHALGSFPDPAGLDVQIRWKMWMDNPGTFSIWHPMLWQAEESGETLGLW